MLQYLPLIVPFVWLSAPSTAGAGSGDTAVTNDFAEGLVHRYHNQQQIEFFFIFLCNLFSTKKLFGNQNSYKFSVAKIYDQNKWNALIEKNWVGVRYLCHCNLYIEFCTVHLHQRAHSSVLGKRKIENIYLRPTYEWEIPNIQINT